MKTEEKEWICWGNNKLSKHLHVITVFFSWPQYSCSLRSLIFFFLLILSCYFYSSCYSFTYILFSLLLYSYCSIVLLFYSYSAPVCPIYYFLLFLFSCPYSVLLIFVSGHCAALYFACLFYIYILPFIPSFCVLLSCYFYLRVLCRVIFPLLVLYISFLLFLLLVSI